MRLSDSIERFIKEMLEQEESEVELKRNELAEYFGCAPSQINYVLATRFSPDHGYMTESRRGGGGYIRIVRITRGGEQDLLYLINERIGEALTETEAARLLLRLKEQRVITDAEAEIMMSALRAQALSLPMPENLKDALRARIMKSMLLTVARQNRQL